MNDLSLLMFQVIAGIFHAIIFLVHAKMVYVTVYETEP